jgi:hypothetical protein
LFGGITAPQEIHNVITEKVTARLDERRTRAEEKAMLTQELRKLVSLYHRRTGRSHAQIHAHLNSLQKIKSQSLCTEKELRERISLIRKILVG